MAPLVRHAQSDDHQSLRFRHVVWTSFLDERLYERHRKESLGLQKRMDGSV